MTNKKSDLCYLDANFLICIFIPKHDFHKPSTKLLVSLLQQKKKLLISCLTLDETWHRAWTTLQNQVPKEKRKPHSEFYNDLKKILDAVLKHPSMEIVQFENNLIQAVNNALENIKLYSLRPRDAFHYALMQDLNIKCIVTNDKGFKKISELKCLSY